MVEVAESPGEHGAKAVSAHTHAIDGREPEECTSCVSLLESRLQDEYSHNEVLKDSDEKLMSQNPLVCFQVPVLILGLKHEDLPDDHVDLVASEFSVEFAAPFGLFCNITELMITIYLTVLVLGQYQNLHDGKSHWSNGEGTNKDCCKCCLMCKQR